MTKRLKRSSMFSSITLLILFTLCAKSTCTPTTIFGAFCSNTTMYANNSLYQANLNTLFHFLSSNATNPSGYHQAVSGYDTNEPIYGHFLCRGDQNATSCQDCVNYATTVDLPKNSCPNRKVAIIWYDECLVRYSNQSFFGEMETVPVMLAWNLNNVTGNMTRFTELLGNMINNVIAVRAATGGYQKKFAATSANFTTFQTIYGLGQCTPDLSPNDCDTCLSLAYVNLRIRQGGRVLMPSCVLRYEVYPFFNLSFLTPGGGSNSTHSSGKVTKITIINNCNYTVWPATTGGSDYNANISTGFTLNKGQSQTISIESSWKGSVWGRTHCSVDTGSFSCQTGDCGTGNIECQGATMTDPATVADFRIERIVKSDTYDVSVAAGYNLPMMVAPNGGSGDRCARTGCVFNLDEKTCPTEFIKKNEKSNMIGCRNPCHVLLFSEDQYCCSKEKVNVTLCQSSSFSLSSLIFSKCPRASLNSFDASTTSFSCKSNQTSFYNVVFCPPANASSELSEPFNPKRILPLGGTTTSSSLHEENKSKVKSIVAIVVTLTVVMLVIGLCTYRLRRRSKKHLSPEIRNVLEDITTAESLTFNLKTLQAATNYFSKDHKLGGGGFGNVYQGTLPNGEQIAVKRLSRISDQGVETFANEAILIAKLQHKNLVRLLGFCIEGEEKLLVYEFLPNKSLNYFLFDPAKQGELDWDTRYKIITGIASGLLYLHEDSRPRIIHRDLKAANILLEADMNPKISDFGLARIFQIEQTLNETSIIVGTYGYMAPEYAMHGQFSTKSDVYSFGVLLLEIVSGKKINSRFHHSRDGDLLTFAWRSWKDEVLSEFIDATLKDSYYSKDEVLSCIHIGLSCVQDDANARPTMSTILFMLNTKSATYGLSIPQCPRSFYHSSTESSYAVKSNQQSPMSSSKDSGTYSSNQLTVSEMNPR